MVLRDYEFRDYILPHRKRMLDTCRRGYEIKWRSNEYYGSISPESHRDDTMIKFYGVTGKTRVGHRRR